VATAATLCIAAVATEEKLGQQTVYYHVTVRDAPQQTRLWMVHTSASFLDKCKLNILARRGHECGLMWSQNCI